MGRQASPPRRPSRGPTKKGGGSSEGRDALNHNISTPGPAVVVKQLPQADVIQASKARVDLVLHKPQKLKLGHPEIVRMLVTVNVAGSYGPLRVIFKENDTVEAVIKATLREYARQGRLPFLSSNVHQYDLFPSISPNFQALGPKQTMPIWGDCQFLMCCKKEFQLTWHSRKACKKTLHILWSSVASSVTKVHLPHSLYRKLKLQDDCKPPQYINSIEMYISGFQSILYYSGNPIN